MSNAQGRRPVTHPRALKIAILLLVLMILVPTVLGRLFAVSSIEVQGNSYCTTEEVIAASGIKLGDSLFSISSGNVKAGINNHRYLEYVGLWKRFFPPSVVLTVSERAPLAKLSWMGLLILIGDNGIVLEQTAQIDHAVHVPEVKGMTIRYVTLGEEIVYDVAGQGEAISGLLQELERQGFLGQVAEINVSSPDSLVLLTEGGMQILLGDGTNLGAKVAIARDILPQIRAQETEMNSYLDVSTGLAADYRRPAGTAP